VLTADPTFAQWARAKGFGGFGGIAPAIANGLNGRGRQACPAAMATVSIVRIGTGKVTRTVPADQRAKALGIGHNRVAASADPFNLPLDQIAGFHPDLRLMHMAHNRRRAKDDHITRLQRHDLQRDANRAGNGKDPGRCVAVLQGLTLRAVQIVPADRSSGATTIGPIAPCQIETLARCPIMGSWGDRRAAIHRLRWCNQENSPVCGFRQCAARLSQGCPSTRTQNPSWRGCRQDHRRLGGNQRRGGALDHCRITWHVIPAFAGMFGKVETK